MSKAELFINGKFYSVSFAPPVRLSKLITSCGAQFSFPCSGRQLCSQCKVIAKGSMSPVSDKEMECLDSLIDDGYRLACSVDATGDVTVSDVPVTFSQKAPITSGVFEVNDPLGKNFGVAFDVGTTTVAAYLCDLKSGKLLSTASLRNPQISFGADVLSRIESALNGRLIDLSLSIKTALSEALKKLCDDANIGSFDVDACVITGNTTMLYLLTATSPESISCAPFKSDVLFGHFEDASFLPLKEGTKAYFVKCISAFIGGDITCSILASRIHQDHSLSSGTHLLADIGTNGEIVLLKNGSLYACSCAAGPAFECVGISRGMSAVSGAVNSVRYENGNFLYTVIGDTEPVGFCGSGLTDLITCLLYSKTVDKNGLLKSDFVLKNTDLAVTQKDIRQFQLAKSAILSGIETLLHCSDTSAHMLDSFEIAGSFGNSLNIQSATDIGMIPKGIKKVFSIGNASGMGACKILFDKSLIDFVDSFADSVTHIELANNSFFAERFINNTSLS